MKKLVSLVLALCLLCMTSAVLAESGDIAGDWYGSMYGMSIQVTFTAEGTYSLSSSGTEISSGTYELKDGVVYMDGDSNAENGFVYDGTTLVNEAQGVTLTQDPEAAQSITLAEVNTEAKLEDFAGEWVCKYASVNGMTVDVTAIPVEQLGASSIPGMKIEGNKVELTGLESLAGSEPMEMEFVDGALVLDLSKMLSDAAESAGADLSSLGLGDLGITMSVTLLQDGMASLSVSMMGYDVAFIFESAAAAEEAPAA